MELARVLIFDYKQTMREDTFARASIFISRFIYRRRIEVGRHRSGSP